MFKSNKKQKLKMGIGITMSILFTYLAVRKIDVSETWQAFKMADYWYLLPSIPILFFSHFLRALRWRYLLDPLQWLSLRSLFSSLMIGYMGNVVMPARMGELLRAYVISRRGNISAGSAFATIVMERIIDVITALLLMLWAIHVWPFPAWLREGAYALLAGATVFFAFLALLRKTGPKNGYFLSFLLKPAPLRVREKIQGMLDSFISGIAPLKRRRHYLVVILLSGIIWGCYGLVFYFSLHAFGFIQEFHLPWSTSLVLLVVTAVGVAIPSSPGYVGTYHYLCQVSLTMYGVPAGPALSFAAVVHAISFLPALLVGLIFSYIEGIGGLKANKTFSASVS